MYMWHAAGPRSELDYDCVKDVLTYYEVTE